jgi:hypothetical protein
MAKRKKAGSVNVSEAIRKAWDADQTQKPAALVAVLAGQGVKTNPGTVATTLSQYRKKLGMKPLRGKKRRGRKASNDKGTSRRQVAEGHSENNGFVSGGSVSSVIEALKLVTKAKQLVGAEGLRELVRAV